MKIAYDYQIFSQQRFGGISRYFFELAYHLSRFNCGMLDCRIFSPVYVNEYLFRSRRELQIKGVSLPAVPRLNQIYRSINTLLAPLEISKWPPDILHETYYSSNSIAPSTSCIVLTVYDMIHELYPELYSVRDRTTENKRNAVERANHIICISNNTRSDLIQLFGVPPEKITVVYLGFALTKFNSFSLIPQRRPFILYVGSRWAYKNFCNLLSAYASRPELRNYFDLVAFGGGRLTPREIEMIQSLHLPLEQVRHLSGDDGILAGLYKQAAMLVYPSLYEGFGMPPLEAMGFGCPVACSNTSSIPEVVGDAAIQFNPFDIESIGNALVKLSSDLDLQRLMIDRGMKRIALFSWEQCAMQTLDIYRALLN